MPDSDSDVTQLLQEWSQGETSALDKLIPLVFDDLREIARRLFRKESDGHTLQPTALVSEVYLRLMDQRKIHWQNSEQFFAVASLMMRRILVDYAKGRQAAKRGSGAIKLPLDDAYGVAEMPENLDFLDLDQALTELAKLDPRQGQIVQMHFFMGLSHEEIAEILGLSPTTVKRDWRTARAWLYRELKG
jgi:RNA polymerase sigma factor (TIGR02999 family)